MTIYAPKLLIDAEKEGDGAYRVTGPGGGVVAIDAAMFEAFFAPAADATVAFFREPASGQAAEAQGGGA